MLLSSMTSTFTLSWRFKQWNQIRTAPVSFPNNLILLQGKENVITKMYGFKPEIIDIAIPTFNGNISSSDFLRSVYIISTSYHNLWPIRITWDFITWNTLSKMGDVTIYKYGCFGERWKGLLADKKKNYPIKWPYTFIF